MAMIKTVGEVDTSLRTMNKTLGIIFGMKRVGATVECCCMMPGSAAEVARGRVEH